MQNLSNLREFSNATIVPAHKRCPETFHEETSKQARGRPHWKKESRSANNRTLAVRDMPRREPRSAHEVMLKNLLQACRSADAEMLAIGSNDEPRLRRSLKRNVAIDLSRS
jgi:hypothetical protein